MNELLINCVDSRLKFGLSDVLPLSFSQDKQNTAVHTSIHIEKFLNLKESEFNTLAVELYDLHARQHSIYAEWIDLLHGSDKLIKSIEDIPFLPISLFKQHKISLFEDHQEIFTSSSTTGTGVSRHFMYLREDYEKTFRKGFGIAYPTNQNQFHSIVALLPGYLDRKGSSLIYMVNDLIENQVGNGGFFNTNYQEAMDALEQQTNAGNHILLFAVTFGLLNLIQIPNKVDWSKVTIIETGGMKGHGKELTRGELYNKISHHLNGVRIDSEYGMTELTSQAYAANGSGKFQCPPWMKVLIRDKADPQAFLGPEKTGKICIIDLANYHSCPFIETDDLGRVGKDGKFEVLGRIDHSDIRGCNLLL